VNVVDTRFTRRDYDLLPEGFPAQLVAGELVKQPAPTYGHQQLALTMLRGLAEIVGWRRVSIAPTDVGIDEWNVFQPDVVALRKPPDDHVRDVGIPLLAVEVLSPSTARRDRLTKRRRMIEAGVAEVWLVDPDAGSVEVHDASGARVARGEEVLRSRAVRGFEVVPARLFGPPEEGPTPSARVVPPGT
jgi:Uma2 family endonuclease